MVSPAHQAKFLAQLDPLDRLDPLAILELQAKTVTPAALVPLVKTDSQALLVTQVKHLPIIFRVFPFKQPIN